MFPLESTLVRHHRLPLWSPFRLRRQSPRSFGYPAIGIRSKSVTIGMKVIGPGYRTRELYGCHLVTMGRGSLWATGVAIRDGLTMTTAGTGTETGIATGGTTRAAIGAMTRTRTRTTSNS